VQAPQRCTDAPPSIADVSQELELEDDEYALKLVSHYNEPEEHLAVWNDMQSLSSGAVVSFWTDVALLLGLDCVAGLRSLWRSA
jgi:hypothetical protein